MGPGGDSARQVCVCVCRRVSSILAWRGLSSWLVLGGERWFSCGAEHIGTQQGGCRRLCGTGVVRLCSETSSAVRLKPTADGLRNPDPTRSLRKSNALCFHGLVQPSTFKALASRGVFNALTGAQVCAVARSGGATSWHSGGVLLGPSCPWGDAVQ